MLWRATVIGLKADGLRQPRYSVCLLTDNAHGWFPNVCSAPGCIACGSPHDAKIAFAITTSCSLFSLLIFHSLENWSQKVVKGMDDSAVSAFAYIVVYFDPVLFRSSFLPLGVLQSHPRIVSILSPLSSLICPFCFLSDFQCLAAILIPPTEKRTKNITCDQMNLSMK